MHRRFLPLFVLISLAALDSPARSADPRPWVTANLESLVQLYRHLHQTPELSTHEEKTAQRMAQELKALGAEVHTGIGGHGVVGFLKNGEGPTVMVRCDMDALPVTENTQLVYASKVRVKDDKGAETGVMHACGHDIHMTNLVGVARYLAAHKDQWKGTAMFSASRPRSAAKGPGRCSRPDCSRNFQKPDYALALHCDSKTAAGKVGYRAGYALANVDSVDITVRGRGGHGAYPHTTIDPIVLAARLILDLQTIVSREIKPTEPCVITVGSIHGGTKHNIIADTCHLELTVRSYTDEVRKQLLDGIKRKAKAVAAGSERPGADRDRLRRHARHVQQRPARGSPAPDAAEVRGQGKRSPRPRRRWGARTSANTAARACPASCSGWGQSMRSGSPATSVSTRSPRRSIRPSSIRTRKQRSPPA